MALIMMDLFLIFGGIFLKYLCKSMKIPCVLDSDKSYSKTIFFSVISQVVEVCSLLASLTLAGGHKTYPVVALQYCRLIGGVELSLKKTAIKSIQTAKMAGLFPISTFKDQLQCNLNHEMKSTQFVDGPKNLCLAILLGPPLCGASNLNNPIMT